MKCIIPEISWHNRGPVLSVDVQIGTWKTLSGDTFWRVVSGGADSHVLIWHTKVNEAGEPVVSCVADLERHQRTVNVVRFSPSGELLASGDDESIIIIWKPRTGSDFPFSLGDDIQNNEQWNSLKVLRGHIEDIYDLSWSPDSNSLASASLDNSVILWNVHKGKKICLLSDYHKGFPQGITWDPVNKYIATISSDRFCRLIDINAKKTVQRVSKSMIPTPAGNMLEGKVVRLFHDDTFKSFFRRLSYTPDGLLLIVPSGIIESHESTEKICNCTVIFSRHNLKEPIAVLPSFEEVTNVVRCCPVFFKLQDDGPRPLIALPYRIVFAVATDNSVILYDTQQIAPIAVISNIHYTRLTDLSWSSDGRILIASSSDGYCSVICFQEGELGKYYKLPFQSNTVKQDDMQENKKKQNINLAAFTECDINAVNINIAQIKVQSNSSNNEKVETIDKIKNNFDLEIKNKVKGDIERKVDEMVEVKSNKIINNTDEMEDFQLVLEDTIVENDKVSVKSTPTKTPVTISARTPRRVKLITLSSPKRTKTM